jgi:hypothetical protein
MADYVKSTDGFGAKVSKGTRLVSISRDCHYDGTGAGTILLDPANNIPFGINFYWNANPSAGAGKIKLPAFGTHLEIGCHSTKGDIFVDTVDMAQTTSGSAYSGAITQDVASTLGVHNFESRSGGLNQNTMRLGIASPIHTSSHYQSFETPNLHELVGGDRNMEQTNLVVTPDGKTWDEVTRDTSYIGNCVLNTSETTAMASGSKIPYTDRRGNGSNSEGFITKDFAIAYDRDICLRTGVYKIVAFGGSINNTESDSVQIYVNANKIMGGYSVSSGTSSTTSTCIVNLKRGDEVSVKGIMGDVLQNNCFCIFKYSDELQSQPLSRRLNENRWAATR